MYGEGIKTIYIYLQLISRLIYIFNKVSLTGSNLDDKSCPPYETTTLSNTIINNILNNAHTNISDTGKHKLHTVNKPYTVNVAAAGGLINRLHLTFSAELSFIIIANVYLCCVPLPGYPANI